MSMEGRRVDDDDEEDDQEDGDVVDDDNMTITEGIVSDGRRNSMTEKDATEAMTMIMMMMTTGATRSKN